MSENINNKIINNAVSAYLMLFISWMLLINKSNPYINNDFVKNHTKSSIIIHLMIIINYIVFISYKFLWSIDLFWFSLNIILANIFFILIWIVFINGIYHATKWELFEVGNFIKKSNGISLDLNNDNNFDEKDKLNILLSHIPFIWFIIGAKLKSDKIDNILKLNLLISVLISLIYVFWHNNITNFISLFYIIFIVFAWVNLYARDELISLSLPYYFLPKWKILLQKVLFKYFSNYFKWQFKNFETLKKEQIEKDLKLEQEELKYLNTLEDVKLNKNLIYIPLLNIIFLFQKENKHTFHIRNAMTISVLLIIVLILTFLSILSTKWLLLVLFPICFGIWKIDTINYKMPYIYEIYRFTSYIKNIFKSSKEEINKRKKEVVEVNLKVK